MRDCSENKNKERERELEKWGLTGTLQINSFVISNFNKEKENWTYDDFLKISIG